MKDFSSVLTSPAHVSDSLKGELDNLSCARKSLALASYELTMVTNMTAEEVHDALVQLEFEAANGIWTNGIAPIVHALEHDAKHKYHAMEIPTTIDQVEESLKSLISAYS